MDYVERYQATLNFGSSLVAIDCPAQQATFSSADAAGHASETVVPFDMIHVCPPQVPLDVIKHSALANKDGWIDVDHHTLRHKQFHDVFGLGDSCATPNAKTAAAAVNRHRW